jgi:hypothetical protein
MGCLLGCFEKYNLEEKSTVVIYEPQIYTDKYIDYYLGTRFDLWD